MVSQVSILVILSTLWLTEGCVGHRGGYHPYMPAARYTSPCTIALVGFSYLPSRAYKHCGHPPLVQGHNPGTPEIPDLAPQSIRLRNSIAVIMISTHTRGPWQFSGIYANRAARSSLSSWLGPWTDTLLESRQPHTTLSLGTCANACRHRVVAFSEATT